MMDRIALISEIHSNIIALKAVLEDIENRGIHKIFGLGDLVLKGSSSCEVVDIINYGVSLGIPRKELDFGGK